MFLNVSVLALETMATHRRRPIPTSIPYLAKAVSTTSSTTSSATATATATANANVLDSDFHWKLSQAPYHSRLSFLGHGQ
jgi:hypothetical protein